jgi:proteasome beta subunit
MNEDLSKHVLKTGTLTIGIVCKEGIVLAADKRTTYGAQGGGVSYIAGTIKKLIPLTERMVATMAGTASDAVKVLEILRAEFKLKELRTREKISVPEAANFMANMVYGNIRQPSMIPAITHFLLAGYDENGTYLYDISPDGLIKQFTTCTASGSGIMQADPILDAEYKKNMSIDEGIALVSKCIKAATAREPGVGSGMDIYVVKKGEIKQVVDKEAVVNFETAK